MRVLALALFLSGCVRSDEALALLDPKIPNDCAGLVTTFDARVAPASFPILLKADVSSENLVLLERAVIAWEAILGPGVFEFTNEDQPCDETTVIDNATLHTVVGLTEFYACNENTIKFLHRLNAGGTNPAWFTDEIVLLILIHELGHDLGLDHEDDDPTSLMYPKIMAGQGFSARTVCAAKFSYERVR
jgi:hypothetical protein